MQVIVDNLVTNVLLKRSRMSWTSKEVMPGSMTIEDISFIIDAVLRENVLFGSASVNDLSFEAGLEDFDRNLDVQRDFIALGEPQQQNNPTYGRPGRNYEYVLDETKIKEEHKDEREAYGNLEPAGEP